MENPFVKLAKKEEGSMDDNSELSPSAEPMTSEEKQKRLAELRQWKSEVEGGMKMEPHRDDPEMLDRINEEIKKLE